MNNKILIKICGLRDPMIARQTALLGVDFIGLVFHPTSKRYVSLTEAKAICEALSQTSAKPVAVFTEHSAKEMQAICEACHIHIVQLHGTRSRAEHALLPSHYSRIYVESVGTSRSAPTHNCDPKCDYILFDSDIPGSGIAFDWDTFQYTGPFRVFLAGGLNSMNVRTAIQKCRPAGIDVSSGVESAPGKKELSLIQPLIQEIQL